MSVHVRALQFGYQLQFVASNAGGTPMPDGGNGVFCNHQKNNSISFSSTEISKVIIKQTFSYSNGSKNIYALLEIRFPQNDFSMNNNNSRYGSNL